MTTQLFHDWPNSPHDNNVSNIFNSNILLGKYHIHVKKWTKAKPNFEHFIKEIKQYGTTLDKIKNKKSKKDL